MSGSAKIFDEDARIRALHSTCLLDTEKEISFDRVSELASRMFAAPIAAATFVDTDRLWFKASVGLDVSQVPRDRAMCAYTVVTDETLIVPDTTLDRRFAANPLVTGPMHVRFYAGAPVHAPDGQAIGTLCVIDRVARHDFGDAARETLIHFACLIEEEIARHVDALARAEAEHKCEVVHSRLNAVVETSLDGIVGADNAGTIVSWNDGMHRIFGYTAEEALDQPLAMIVPPSRRAAHQTGMERRLQSGQPRLEGRPVEVVGLHKNGHEIPLELTLSSWAEGERMMFGAVIRDISERRATEEERERTMADLVAARQEAEAAAEAKTAFLANMSHELRTPLNAIIGFAQMLQAGFVNDPAKITAYARDIAGSGEHLLGIINSVLDLTKAENDRLRLDLEDTDIRKVVESAVRMVEPTAAADQQYFQVDLPEADVIGRVDAGKLRQVLLNVLSNAVKFSEAGATTRVALADQGTHIAITVRDEGIGMDDRGCIRAFESFGQVDSSLARRYEGTGLGLPLAAKLMDLHGGSLKLSSQLGCGTTVDLRVHRRGVSTPIDAPNY